MKKVFKPDVQQFQKELKEMSEVNEQLRKRLASQPIATVVPVQSQVGIGQRNTVLNANLSVNQNRIPPPPPSPCVANVACGQNGVYPFRFGTQ